MELWDIYDERKERTGRTMERDDWHMKPGEYHLSVLAVIQRPDGKFLITKRAEDKPWAAGWWEVPGGSAIAGESSEEAVHREIQEETGLDVSGSEGGFLFGYHRDNPDKGENYFVDVYRYEMDFEESDVHLQAEETIDYQIADLDQIREYARQGIFLHYQSIRQAFE